MQILNFIFFYFKDSLLADEAFLFVNSSPRSLSRMLYDEFVKSVLKIVEKLDLTLERQNVAEKEVRFCRNNSELFLYHLSVECCRKLVSSALLCVIDPFLFELHNV